MPDYVFPSNSNIPIYIDIHSKICFLFLPFQILPQIYIYFSFKIIDRVMVMMLTPQFWCDRSSCVPYY